jgi:hypothetical protein
MAERPIVLLREHFSWHSFRTRERLGYFGWLAFEQAIKKAVSQDKRRRVDLMGKVHFELSKAYILDAAIQNRSGLHLMTYSKARSTAVRGELLIFH